jgi:poly(glycerol-phosphate) alpha-glucosyltransferase
VAGGDEDGETARLEEQVARSRLGGSVLFPGPLFGPAKEAAFWNASALVLPSLDEGLPLAVLEAWAHRLPVLMTPQCNLPEGFTAGAALPADPDPQSLAAALHELMGMTEAERKEMGGRGRELASARFGWPRLAAEMAQVYRWLLGGGSPPASLWR